MAKALRIAKEKTRGVEIARACHIHNLGNGNGGNGQDLIIVGHNASPGRARYNGDGAILAKGLQGAVKALREVERLELGFIGKDDIDAVPDEIEEAFAVAFDAKRIRERD